MRPVYLSLVVAAFSAVTATAADYAVVVSKATQAKPEWKEVVTALARKHQGSVVTFDRAVEEALPELRRQGPRYVAFVAQPVEAGRDFVARVHRLTRRFDDDPYTDCFWGIVTGYDAAAALRLARLSEPLTIRKAASGTEIPLANFEEGTWYSELQKNRMERKEHGKPPTAVNGPDDTTKALAELLTDYHADLFITSGHATEHDWQIGYGYRNGSFRCEAGQLIGRDAAGNRFPIVSTNPKVFLPIGNCLMGHIDGSNAMALAYMNSAGVSQMLGYTVTTWYGYAGWGCLDYFIEQPGRFTFAEACFANEHALIHRLATYCPDLLAAEITPAGRASTNIVVSAKAKAAGLTEQDGLGLLYDRDTLAFYGDPAWEARLAPTALAWDQTLTQKNGLWTLLLRANIGADSFLAGNKNGSQRGGRPVVQYLPQRLQAIQVLEGAELEPVITKDFILVPNPGRCQPGHVYRVVFRAEPRR